MKRVVWRFAGWLTLLMAFVPSTARAQYNTAEISGVVRDAQGGVLPGAMVVATHLASGQKSGRLADGSGRFFLPNLAIGQYTVSVELEGFKQFLRQALVLQVGQKIELPVTLEIARLTDTVTITGMTPLLQTANAEVADVIDNRQVVELPLNGR